MTETLRRPVPGWPAPTPWAVLPLAFLLQLPLVLNPGYFSHDELQWAAHAVRGEWFAWTAFDAFQYRPLTFNLWMVLSRALFDTPQAFHAVLVLWGSANAALLCATGRRFGVPGWAAALGALVFALGPYATYTHGWVGCIADLVWLGCTLVIAWMALRMGDARDADGPVGKAVRMTMIALVAATFTGVGLLAKEAALSIPALGVVAWLFDARRRASWLAATSGAIAIVLLYLALRLDALLHAPREGAQYAVSLAHLPLRWIEYQLFAPIVPLFETFTTFGRGIGTHIVLAMLMWIALAAAVWRASPRLFAVFVFGGIAALGPVLLMGSSWNHYAYGFAAVTALVVAAAWSRAPRWGRVAIAAFASATVLHGAFVMLRMHEVGRVQSVFSPALAQAVRGHSGTLRLRPAADAREWIFVRLTHDIPEYDGVPIGNRMQMVGANEAADYVIAADGRLVRMQQ